MSSLRTQAVAGSGRLGACRQPSVARKAGVAFPTAAKVTPHRIQRRAATAPLFRTRNPARPSVKVAPRAEAQEKLPSADGDQNITLYRRAKLMMKNNQKTVTALINTSIVCGVAAGASYHILEIDWQIARGWTLTEFLLATAQDDFMAYQHAAATNPFFTKACTSGVAYLLGDFAAQTFQGRTLFDLDLTRTLRSGIAGFCIHGPLCHLWIEWMEAHLSFGGAWYSTFAKVVADQTVWSLFLNTMYTSTILGLSGKGPRVIKDEVNSTWWPAISSGWRFWPFVHMISFSPYVPTDLKLLFIDTMEIIWVTILATVVNSKQQETTPVLSCSIEPGTMASMPYAAIEIAKSTQLQPVIEKSDGTSELVVLDDEALAELQDMSDAADAAYLLSSLQEESVELVDPVQDFVDHAMRSIDELPTYDALHSLNELPTWDEDSADLDALNSMSSDCLVGQEQKSKAC